MAPAECETHFLHEVLGSSDRAGAIVGAAFLEEQLLAAISTRLTSDSAAIENLFGPGKPLSTLPAKAEMGYLLGLYSKTTRDEIRKVAWIHDRFVQFRGSVTFSENCIAQECKTLQLPVRFARSMIPNYTSPVFDDNSHPPGYWAKYCYVHFIDTLAALLGASDPGSALPIP